MVVKGYKCFNEDFTNRHGIKFSIGKIYASNELNNLTTRSNGFHLCKNLEDTFRYFDALSKDVIICEVIGSGNITTYSDKYNGYYDMYAAENLEIKKKLSREEILNIGLSLDELKVIRFIQGFKLSFDEINLFKEKFKSNEEILNNLFYYQEQKIKLKK